VKEQLTRSDVLRVKTPKWEYVLSSDNDLIRYIA
jgi:hypothetical protein